MIETRKNGIKNIVLMSLSLMLLSAFVVACGGSDESSSAPAAAAPAASAPAASAPAKEAPKAAASAAPTAVPAVKPTVAPVKAEPAKDSIVVVINQEPSDPDTWKSTTLYPNQITHNITQPVSFLGPDFVDHATVGFESWEMHDGGASWTFKLPKEWNFITVSLGMLKLPNTQ